MNDSTTPVWTPAQMRQNAEVFDKGDWMADIRPHRRVASMLRQAADQAEREMIICAAIQMPDGYVIRGHRHNDALNVAAGMPRYQPLQVTPEAPILQGFVTSRNRFVSRQEASQIHRGTDADLFSEDLY